MLAPQFWKGEVKMQETLEDTVKFKRRFKRVLLVLAVIEFVVTAVGVFYMMQK